MIPDPTADALIEAALRWAAYHHTHELAPTNRRDWLESSLYEAVRLYREAHAYASDPLNDFEAGFWGSPATVRHLASRIDKLVARVQKLEM